MKRMFRLLEESKIATTSILLIALLASISSLFAVLPPHFLGAAINSIVETDSKNPSIAFSSIEAFNAIFVLLANSFDFPPVVSFLALFFVSNLVHVLIRIVFSVFVAVLSDRFILFIRKKCFSKILHGETKDLEKFESGDLVYRTMSDSTQINSLTGSPIYTVLSDFLDLLWMSAIILLIDWRILLILASIVPFLFIISRKTAKLQRSFAIKLQKNEAHSTGFVQRSVLGIDTVKAYQGESKDESSFSSINRFNYNIRKATHVNLAKFYPQEGLLQSLATVGVVSYSAYLATQDPSYIGTIPILLVYATKFYAPLRNWTRYYQSIQRGIASYQRVIDILNIKNETFKRSLPLEFSKILPFTVDGHITLESGRTVHLSLKVTKPTLVILKGKSGVGKSRLIKSLLGLGLKFEGDIILGDNAYTNHKLLRNHIALATQDGHFIPGTVADNICYPESKTDKDKCKRILEALSLGYNPEHTIAEFGRNLSIGEQRRIIFGRALYSNKPILILDEIDANVDEATRMQLYEIIRLESKKKVIIMVSHVHTSHIVDSDMSIINICSNV